MKALCETIEAVGKWNSATRSARCRATNSRTRKRSPAIVPVWVDTMAREGLKNAVCVMMIQILSAAALERRHFVSPKL